MAGFGEGTRGETRRDGLGARARPALARAFDTAETPFTKASEALVDLVENPPAGPYGYDLLHGGVRELKGMLLRRLPLATVREARAAQAASMARLLEDSASLALGQAVDSFLGRLQAAADAAKTPDAAGSDAALVGLERSLDRALATGATAAVVGDLAARIAAAPCATLPGVLIKLRTHRRLAQGPFAIDPAVDARLLDSATGAVEGMVLAAAVADFDAAVAIVENEAVATGLPPGARRGMIAGFRRAGRAAADRVRRVAYAVAAALFASSRDMGK